MSLRIKKIYIRAFRGIVDLELDLNGKSLLVYGDNGTGKSSIVDAIEFFFTGKVTPLTGVEELSIRRHAPHVKFKANDVKVSMMFTSEPSTLTRTLDSAYSLPPQFKDYFEVTQKGTFILRRSQLLVFINSKPADRYRAIGNIIGVESLDNIELELMRLRDELKGKMKSKEKGYKKLLERLSKTTKKKINDIDDVIKTLNDLLKKANLPLIKSLNEVTNYPEKLHDIKEASDKEKKIRFLNEISNSIKKLLIDLKDISIHMKTYDAKLIQFIKPEMEKYLSELKLLKYGKILLEKETLDRCPLCNQRINRNKVLREISDRLKFYEEFSKEASELRETRSSLTEDLERFVEKLIILQDKMKKIPELHEERAELESKLNLLKEARDLLKSAKKFTKETSITEYADLNVDMEYLLNGILKKCSNILKTEYTPKERRILSLFILIGQVLELAKDIVNVHSELKKCKDYHKLAETMFNVFSQVKKKRIQKIYDKIQGDIEKFYSIIHPNEPRKNIELKVVFGRRASTKIKIKSFDRKEDPRALESEGHLDSLGLCIFLAFVKNFNKGCSLVVLDDVVTTVDANHRSRIAQLLLTEFRDYQLIITTQDEVWYEQITSLQRALKIQNEFMNLKIVRWEVDTGPFIEKYKPRWESIYTRLESGDKIGAGVDCRRYLEWLLKEICERFEVPVRFKKDSKYTVSELFDPVEKRIRDKLKDCDLKNKILDKLKDLRSTSFMGNILSHDNTVTLSLEEVKTFCKAVHELHEVLLCPDCGRFLKYFRESKIIRCPNLKCSSTNKIETY